MLVNGTNLNKFAIGGITTTITCNKLPKINAPNKYLFSKNPTFISVLSGKINTVFDLDEVLK